MRHGMMRRISRQREGSRYLMRCLSMSGTCGQRAYPLLGVGWYFPLRMRTSWLSRLLYHDGTGTLRALTLGRGITIRRGRGWLIMRTMTRYTYMIRIRHRGRHRPYMRPGSGEMERTY